MEQNKLNIMYVASTFEHYNRSQKVKEEKEKKHWHATLSMKNSSSETKIGFSAVAYLQALLILWKTTADWVFFSNNQQWKPLWFFEKTNLIVYSNNEQ